MNRRADFGSRGVVPAVTVRGLRAGYRRDFATEFGRENAATCVSACFDALVPNVEDACRLLQHPAYQRRLWDLYCCDSVNCGVYIGTIGQSPNVDLIINKCQNIGFFSIEDPGPPASDYCASSTPNPIETSPSPTIAVEPPTGLASRTRGIDSMPSSYTSATSILLAPTPSSTSSPIPANANSSQLTGGAKAVISVFSVIAVLAVAALLLLLYLRRRQNPLGRSPGPFSIPYDNRSYPGPPSGSQSPLITPLPSASSRTAPLAPPAKLSDRKYLQPVPRNNNISQSPASSIVGDQTPQSTLTTAPKQSTTIPQYGQHATSSTRLPRTTTAPIRAHCPPSSVYSSSSGPDVPIIAESNKAGSVHSGSVTLTGPNTSPLPSPRFPRAHDGAAGSSGHVTPAGPPPSRALPPLPPNHPSSPTFPSPSMSPRSPTFPGQPLARGESPTVSPPQPGVSTEAPGPTPAQELCELTEACARETRESWGSWSGVGGGGPGVTPPGRKRASGERKKGEGRTAVALQELDLEKLGGRY